ncbi:MAG: 4-hydroxythreonine-4-phosphate dehydrogenase PdxA [Pseudomonadota bacterium]
MTRPVAMTIGEPAGIGPELAVTARQTLGQSLPFFLIGDPRHLPPRARVATIEDPSEASDVPEAELPVLAHEFAGEATPGQPDPANAAGVIAVIARGVELVTEGRASALCTAPIHKQALIDGAGFAHPGHTEYLAELAGVDRVVMMLAGPSLRVVPATIHIPVRDVSAALTAELIEAIVRITHAALRNDFGIAAPRIAVAGLNPHAGEGGKIGQEDLQIIAPALHRLRAQGFDLKGPQSGDTLFHAAARAGYDAAITMYHDQALIPIKTIDFDSAVNVTLGLPFVRTSPDHGTAFDIAGTGRANPASTIAALRMARAMAEARRAAGRG